MPVHSPKFQKPCRCTPLALRKLLGGFTPWHAAWTTHEQDHKRYHAQRFYCIRVPDGDTVSLAVPDGKRRSTSVRLIGIDAPEMRRDGPRPDYFAVKATNALIDYAYHETLRVMLKATQNRCKYRRLLAYLYTDDHPVSLNLRMIAHGFAYADNRYPHPRSALYRDAEAYARRNSAGLWAGVDFSRLPRWRQRQEMSERGPLFLAWRNRTTPSFQDPKGV